jgi:LacI family transcriptional regulator
LSVPDYPNVAILVQTSTAWGREIVEGIAEFVQERGPWLVFIESRGLHEPARIPPRWRGDGIIARVDSPELARQIEELRIPAVNVAWSSADPLRIPNVRVDDEVCGTLAAEHLLEAGLPAFGYVGQDGRPPFMNERIRETFAGRLAASGATVRNYVPPMGSGTSFRAEIEHLAGWLRGFGRPVGILAFGDAEARLVIDACRIAGLRVPEDVAIVGAEQDPLMSALGGIGISSVNINGQVIGYRAAELLAAMMRGETAPAVTRIAPTGVIGRESTDGTAVSDELVREALVFIRDHITSQLRVRDLARELGVARRTLESRFRAAVDRSPGEAIRRLRVEKAARLLSDTQLPLARVAELCGYAEPRLLTAHFRQVHGVTPTSYRRSQRSGGTDEAAAGSGAEPRRDGAAGRSNVVTSDATAASASRSTGSIEAKPPAGEGARSREAFDDETVTSPDADHSGESSSARARRTRPDADEG